MRLHPRVGRISLLVALVALSLSIASYIGWLRLKPEVSAIAWIANKAGYENHVVNIHHRAMSRVQPGALDAYLPIYDIQNPGFFLLVDELFVRAGATTPLPLEILSIVLFNIGALCFLFWVYPLFGDLVVAASATAFLALSQFFLFFPGVTHTMPFEFVFFNITLLLFVLHLKNGKPAYLAGALVAMFLTCMNYWFYYMSSWIIIAAAVLLLAACSLFFWPYLKKQYALIRQTTSISYTVEEKYQQAIRDICRTRSSPFAIANVPVHPAKNSRQNTGRPAIARSARKPYQGAELHRFFAPSSPNPARVKCAVSCFRR